MQALVDVDLDDPAGQVTALAGDNGAGKSVLIKCIAGHPHARRRRDPVGGRAGAHPYARATPPRSASRPCTRTSRCATTSTSSRTCSSGGRRTRGVCAGRGGRWRRRPARRCASLAVTTVRSVRQPVASLSGGQRQSVAIAKAVLWNSKLVIMDEPTAALGVAQTAMVLDLVRTARRPGAGGADRVAQHERRVPGGRPRSRCSASGGWSAVQPAAEIDAPDRRRPHDHAASSTRTAAVPMTEGRRP